MKAVNWGILTSVSDALPILVHATDIRFDIASVRTIPACGLRFAFCTTPRSGWTDCLRHLWCEAV